LQAKGKVEAEPSNAQSSKEAFDADAEMAQLDDLLNQRPSTPKSSV